MEPFTFGKKEFTGELENAYKTTVNWKRYLHVLFPFAFSESTIPQYLDCSSVWKEEFQLLHRSSLETGPSSAQSHRELQ